MVAPRPTAWSVHSRLRFPTLEPVSDLIWRGAQVEPIADRPVGLYSPAMPRGSRSSESPRQGTRNKILEVAEVQFARGGYQGVGMRRLAAAVGLSKSALFHHFPTKLELYEEVLDRVLERLELAQDGGASSCGGPVERLDAWIDSLVRSLANEIPSARLLIRAMLEEEPFSGFLLEPRAGHPLRAAEMRWARIREGFEALVEEGVAAGVFRPLSVGDALQATIGAIVFHVAAGDLGDALHGESMLSVPDVEGRRKEVSEFIRGGLLAVSGC